MEDTNFRDELWAYAFDTANDLMSSGVNLHAEAQTIIENTCFYMEVILFGCRC